METKDYQIAVSVVYKALSEKGLGGEVDFALVKQHVQSFIKVVKELESENSVPFENKSRGLEVQAPRPVRNYGTANAQQAKELGATCSSCGQGKYVQSKAGKLYCDKLCWKK